MSPEPKAAQLPDRPPAMVMTRMLTTGLSVTQALYAAAELGIADLLASGPQSVAFLAASCGAVEDRLCRLLRALASLGVFTEVEPHRFALTPLAQTLRSDYPGSLRSVAAFWGDPRHWQAWCSFLHGIKTGDTPWRNAFGLDAFEYFDRNPDMGQHFAQAMTSFSLQDAAALAAAHDYPGIAKLADIGGGHGYLLAAILKARPGMRGLLFERAQVAAEAPAKLAELGVADRVEVVAGSFFEHVPPGADGYILKSILHDFEDEAALKILINCRQAMHDKAKLYVIQQPLPDVGGAPIARFLDLQLMLMGGRGRSEAEYRTLCAKAGLTLRRIIPSAGLAPLLECVPA